MLQRTQLGHRPLLERATARLGRCLPKYFRASLLLASAGCSAWIPPIQPCCRQRARRHRSRRQRARRPRSRRRLPQADPDSPVFPRIDPQLRGSRLRLPGLRRRSDAPSAFRLNAFSLPCRCSPTPRLRLACLGGRPGYRPRRTARAKLYRAPPSRAGPGSARWRPATESARVARWPRRRSRAAIRAAARSAVSPLSGHRSAERCDVAEDCRILGTT
jgi:hypothetical protein